MGKLSDFFSSASTESASPAGDGDQGSDNLGAVRAELAKGRRRASKVEREAAAAAYQAALDELYTPENWAEISTLYFDTRYVLTGDDVFLVTEREKAVLGTSLAATARLLLAIDPGYVAMIIFLGNMGKMIAVKESQHKRKKKVAAQRVVPIAPRPSG